MITAPLALQRPQVLLTTHSNINPPAVPQRPAPPALYLSSRSMGPSRAHDMDAFPCRYGFLPTQGLPLVLGTTVEGMYVVMPHAHELTTRCTHSVQNIVTLPAM